MPSPGNSSPKQCHTFCIYLPGQKLVMMNSTTSESFLSTSVLSLKEGEVMFILMTEERLREDGRCIWEKSWRMHRFDLKGYRTSQVLVVRNPPANARGIGFNPLIWEDSHAVEKVSMRASSIESVLSSPVAATTEVCTSRVCDPQQAKPPHWEYALQQWAALLAATRENLSKAMKTQHSQNK